MATHEGTIYSFPPHQLPQICNYCIQPTTQPIPVSGKTYCRKLCLMMDLLKEIHAEDQIMDEFGEFDKLVDGITGGSLPFPIKVRFSDLEDLENVERFVNRAPEGYVPVLIQISDSGTPDWIPPEGKHLTVDQKEVDRVVEDLLRNGDAQEGQP